MPGSSSSRWLLLFLTGLGSVTFELAAVRLLATLFGSTVHSSALVTSVFLAGLALGAVWFGRRADRHAAPGRLFARLALAGGIAALLAPWIIPWLAQPLLALASFDLGVGRFLALLPAALIGVGVPAVLLGGTLPALVADQRDGLDRSAPGLLYAVNTFGAVMGAALAGFVLLEFLGTRACCLVGAGLLVVAGGAALLLLRQTGPPVAPVSPASPPVAALPKSIGLAAGAAGFAALALEVLGTRLLMQYLSSSAHAFAAVLVVYLSGTAAGALLGAAACRRGVAAGVLVPRLLALLAVAVALVAPAIQWLGRALDIGMLRELPGQLALAAVLLPATLASGALFAVLVGGFDSADRAGGHVGAIVGANTIGAVLGALIAAFWWIHALGAALACVAAGGVAWLALVVWRGSRFPRELAGDGSRRPAVRREAVTSLLTGVVIAGLAVNAFDMRSLPAAIHPPLYYAEGPIANVIVARSGDDPRPVLFLDRVARQGGGTSGLVLERRQGLLPLALQSETRSALLLGVGTGATLSAVLDGGVREVDAVDLVGNVFDVMAYFDPARRDPRQRPGVTPYVADAVAFARQARRSYDLILGDLYYPWMDGAGALYSLEHFRAVRGLLSDRGLFCQWVPLHQMRWEDFGLLCRTFVRVFPQTAVFLVDARASLPIVGLIGQKAPLRLDPDELATRVSGRGAAAAFDGVGLATAEDVLQLYLGDQLTLDAAFGGDRALGEDELYNSLDRPVLEYRAARTTESEGTLALNNLNNLTLSLAGSVGDILRPAEPDAAADPSLADAQHQAAAAERTVALQRRCSALRKFLAGHYWRLRAGLGIDDAVGMQDMELSQYLQGLVYDSHLDLLNDAALRIGKERFLAGRYTAAVEACRAISEHNPADAGAARCAGLSLLMLSQFEAAAQWLQRAAELQDQDAALLAELGIAQYLAGADDAARDTMVRARAVNAARISQLGLAVAAATRGEVADSRRQLERLSQDAQWGGLARRALERLESAR